jgi:hypothetical protein
VRDETALGEPHEARKSKANSRLEACTLCPSLAIQASILPTLQHQKTQAKDCALCPSRDSGFMRGVLGKTRVPD